MPALTRRRAKDAHQECWHIIYGDVHVGTITERAGVPHDVDQWGWDCGFYPVTHRREHAEGTAVSLEQARADFEAAWTDYLPKCTPADFKEYRRQRAWTGGSTRCTTPGRKCRRWCRAADRDASAALPSILPAAADTFTRPT
jgi:hypothetical protein